MTDKELFDRTFLKMHASEDTLKEVYSVIERKESKAYSKRIGFIGAAVAVMIALSVTAFAAHSRWSPFLADAFGVSEAQQSELLDLGVTSFVGRSTESSGITLTAEQVIGDEYGCYVLLRLETDNPEIFRHKAAPRIEIYLDNDTSKQILENWSWTDWTLENDCAAMYIGCWTSGKSGHDITVTLTGLMGPSEQDYSNVWEGCASLSWSLSFNDDTTERYRVVSDKNTVAGPTIEHICVTPVSVCVYYDAGSVREFMTAEDCNLQPVSLTLEDGSKCDLSMSASRSTFISDRNGAEVYYMVQVSTEQLLPGGFKEIGISTGNEVINYRLVEAS